MAIRLMVCLAFLFVTITATMTPFASAGGPPAYPCYPPASQCGPQAPRMPACLTLCSGILSLCPSICGAIINIPSTIMRAMLAPPIYGPGRGSCGPMVARYPVCGPVPYMAPRRIVKCRPASGCPSYGAPAYPAGGYGLPGLPLPPPFRPFVKAPLSDDTPTVRFAKPRTVQFKLVAGSLKGPEVQQSNTALASAHSKESDVPIFGGYW